MAIDADTKRAALLVIERKARARKAYPAMSEDHLKDDALMSLARDVIRLRDESHRRSVADNARIPGKPYADD